MESLHFFVKYKKKKKSHINIHEKVKEYFFVKTFLFSLLHAGGRVVYLLYMALIKGFEREETFLLLYGSLCQLGSSTSI